MTTSARVPVRSPRPPGSGWLLRITTLTYLIVMVALPLGVLAYQSVVPGPKAFWRRSPARSPCTP